MDFRFSWWSQYRGGPLPAAIGPGLFNVHATGSASGIAPRTRRGPRAQTPGRPGHSKLHAAGYYSVVVRAITNKRGWVPVPVLVGQLRPACRFPESYN
jgi:hypothetical protein